MRRIEKVPEENFRGRSVVARFMAILSSRAAVAAELARATQSHGFAAASTTKPLTPPKEKYEDEGDESKDGVAAAQRELKIALHSTISTE